MKAIVVDLMACDGRFFQNDEDSYSVVFDDDGRVAYAYLLNPAGSIVGDVWLYNRCSTPVESEWKDPEKMPFANPQAYVNESDQDAFQVVDSISDVKVDWCNEAEKVKARIYIRNKYFASLVEGAKPGSSLLAGKDGPLAKVLNPK